MQTCSLPYKSARDNTKFFLTSVGAIDDTLYIKDKELLDESLEQLKKEIKEGYNLEGVPYLIDPARPDYIIPNTILLNQIDEKRKQLEIYDDQEEHKVNLGEEFKPFVSDETVQYQFKIVSALQSDKVRQPKYDNLQGFYNDLQKQGVSNQQLDFVKNILSDIKGNVTKEDIIRELLVKYSYSVEINTIYYIDERYVAIPKEFDEYEDVLIKEEIPTQYYSNLNVPGGKKYKENEIRTPGIIPNIKGHAEFATSEGIGWFRSDDKKNDSKTYIDPKTRRILEVQSDLFQKGRDRKELISILSEDRIEEIEEEVKILSDEVRESRLWNYENMKRLGIKFSNYEQYEYYLLTKTNPNQFLQLLNKDNQWVTFFVKSIVQDSAKRGYEKVLFPSGDTASKVEGHTTLEEFKKQKEDRIKDLEKENKELELEIQEKGFINSELERQVFSDNEYEIKIVKEELERVEKEGFGALRPIFNFYENTVGNILKKQYRDINRITDEYGNQWWELSIDRSRDLSDIMFQLSTEDVLPNEITSELKNVIYYNNTFFIITSQIENFLIDNKIIEKVC